MKWKSKMIPMATAVVCWYWMGGTYKDLQRRVVDILRGGVLVEMCDTSGCKDSSIYLQFRQDYEKF